MSRHRPSWARPNLLGVWAHPDDESYLSAALMRRVVRTGGNVTVISATSGEAGTSDPGADPRSVGDRRTAELRSAMGWLGVTDVRVLDHVDGGCIDSPARGATDRIRQIIHDVRPHLVVTFGPDGITGHPDHAAVSRWTTAAWTAVRAEPGALPFNAQLLYATMTEQFVARHLTDYAELPLTLYGDPVAVADDDVVLRVRPDAGERRRKRLALDAHASQTTAVVDLLGPDRFHDWWIEETFRHPTAAEIGDALEAVHGTKSSPHSLQTGSKQSNRESVTVAA